MSRPVASSGSTFSVIGSDVIIKGDLSASADLHVDGTVEGDIACASLVQGESSRIEGAIEAQTARLAGRVKGTINVRELVILRSAQIEGDVHYDALTIEQGAQVEGRFAHDAAKPASKPAATPATSPTEKKDDGEPRLTLAG
ncbi:MAG TPA: polymer-forming cytoskeletal protein [Croceibacterium sp.]|jgi:cytoskeletal protein CcmA (bactofilin family)